MNLALVFGGSSGIGKSICEKLKDEYLVVNMSRRKNNEVDNIYVDVEDNDSITNGFRELKEKYGTPKFLTLSMGYVKPQGLLEIDYEILMKTYKVNLISAFTITQEFVKLCDKTQESKIVYIGSTAGSRPQPGWSCYSSSKAGIINFALTMGEELKSYKVKIYCLSPGRTDTPLRKILSSTDNPDTLMQPQEIADFVYYIIKYDQILNNQNIILKRNIIGG